MYARILVPLDGSPYAEEVLRYAAGIARAGQASLALIRVSTHEDESLDGSTAYLRALAQEFDAEALPVVAPADGVPEAIMVEANREPRALIAMTSHGRSGLLETVLGSVSGAVFRSIGRPVLLYHPKGQPPIGRAEVVSVRTVVLPLDASNFAETMEPIAGATARWLGAGVEVVQAISVGAGVPAGIPSGDVLESSYVRHQAERIANTYGVPVNWEVLHGNPGDAICDHVAGREDAILAMTSHGLSGVKAMLMGSVAAVCLRRSGVPILVRALSR